MAQKKLPPKQHLHELGLLELGLEINETQSYQVSADMLDRLAL